MFFSTTSNTAITSIINITIVATITKSVACQLIACFEEVNSTETGGRLVKRLIVMSDFMLRHFILRGMEEYGYWHSLCSCSYSYLFSFMNNIFCIKYDLRQRTYFYRKILWAVLEWSPKKYKNAFFGHLIPYNPGFRIFSEKLSCSKNGPYCPLHLCKKLGRSSEQFWSKVQRSKKTHLFAHLIPYNPGLRIFSEKQSWTNNWPYYPLHSCKNWKDPRAVLE